MLASAYTLRSDAHVRVDVFYRRFTPRTRAIIDLLGSLLFLLPMAGFILWSSLDYVEFSWRLKEKSQEAEGLPWLYLLKTLIPLMGGLLIWQGLIEILRNAVILAGRGTSSQQEGVR
jgi:TRAP-type mannitol/chloroaromatic compound transport system permease small subunit